ncbi:FAD binding domain-containing protein [Chloroflexota bacterium]
MQDFDFLKPKTLSELCVILAETGGNILAGGTDIIPKMRRSHFSTSLLVDASQIEELRFIRKRDGKITIGAMTTHQELTESPLLAEENPALVNAALTVGCQQTRNRGTIGGNIANASPAADTIPPLLIVDADIHLIGKLGERTIPLDEFLISPGKTKLVSGELIHSISFRTLTGAWGMAFAKLGKRKGMAISVVNAAAAIEINLDGRISKARLCLGSVAPKVVRSHNAEDILIGQHPTPDILDQAAQMCKKNIVPINDVRSTAEYRKKSAVVIARRVLGDAVDQTVSRFL